MSTVDDFNYLVATKGSPVIFHREDYDMTCPCVTPEGYRDPEWHLEHPEEIVCNAEGMLPGESTHREVKAFLQPIQSSRATRLNSEFIPIPPHEVEVDDHLGIFPVVWNGLYLDFYNWGRSGEDYIEFDGRRFIVVNVNKLADPSDGNPNHHYEVGLRLMRDG